MSQMTVLALYLMLAVEEPTTISKVVVVTLYRELQASDFRKDHRLMLEVIENRAAQREMSYVDVCLARWQFSYWNKFWDNNKSTVTQAIIDSEYAKVPKAFIESLETEVVKVYEPTGINHFYSPGAMKHRHSGPAWAKGRKPTHKTSKFWYFAI